MSLTSKGFNTNMASITRLFKYFPLVHVQGEAHTFIIVTKGGESTGGRGFGCWFWPVGTAISEVPLSDQSVSLTLKGKTRDFQEVTVTAQAWYEVTDARIISSRFDFSVNVATGEFNSDPLTVIEGALTSAAQAAVWDHVAQFNLTDILTSGLEKLAEEVSAALSNLDFGALRVRLCGTHGSHGSQNSLLLPRWRISCVPFS